MSSLYPQAAQFPTEAHSGDMTEHLGLILHVAEANGTLRSYFGNPAHEASSTFWVGKSGYVEQYVDADLAAWAQAEGNHTYNSVETEGYTTEPLSLHQIESLAELYAWGHRKYGWPFRLAEKPGEAGLGWHGMGGEAWGGHSGCPGDKRKAQRQEILDRAEGKHHAQAAQNDLPGWYHRVLENPPSKLRDPGPVSVRNGYQVGPDVAAVQRKLAINVDGTYGPTTEAHIKGFQKLVGLAVDGRVGPETARKLQEKR